MVVSVVAGLVFMPLFGKFSDRCSPRITLPVSFGIRALALTAFMFIKDPSGYFSYVVSTLLVIGTGAESIAIDTLLYRQSDREIRGVVFGTAMACGFTG
jgi:MFS family permease